VSAQERFARRVNMEVASHTAFMDPILDELRTALADLAPQEPRVRFLSTVVDGQPPRLDADYWVANVRQPVRFTQTVAAAGQNHAVFIEISPHPLLTHAIGDTLGPASASELVSAVAIASTMRRDDDETRYLHTQLAELNVDDGAGAGTGRFTGIPATPWLHTAHWMAGPPERQQTPAAHPLLGVHVEMLSGHDHIWQADITGDAMPWLADQVQGQPVLPAAAFIEMAVAAGRQALGLPVGSVRVTGLEIEQNLVLDRQLQVTTQLGQAVNQPGAAGHVEIHARTAGGDWIRYAVAHLEAAQDAPVSPSDPAAATEITRPDDAADHPDYCIHPALLDAALRQLAATIPVESAEDRAATSYLPMSVASVRVFGPVGRRVRCHTGLTGAEQDGGGFLGQVTLMDDTGAAVAELTGIRLQPIDPGTLRLALDQKIFGADWIEGAVAPGPATAAGSWLLLVDPDTAAEPETQALAAGFAARLSAPSRRVITAPLTDGPELLEALTQAAADPALPPAGIVVFIGPGPFNDVRPADQDAALVRARELIWTTSVLARSAVQHWPGTPGISPRLWLVSRNGLAVRNDEPGDPAVGALKGLIRTWRFPGELARVLADEPDLGATLVDLDAGDADGDDPEALTAQLMTELQAPATDSVIAWRQQRRFVERLVRVKLDAETPAATVRADGAYILTGGLGGLGTVVARWLVTRGAGRLVLNGRSAPSDAQRSLLAELAAGAEVVFVRGDISAPGVAEQLVAAAEETGRPLRGVVHAAGVLGEGLVTAVSRENLEQVWAAKATGALRLHAATATRQLDWWVGFSSMAALLGLPGQLGYATANAWLDALLAWRRASGLPATAINWGQWSDVGIGRSLTLSVLDPIAPDEGTEALDALLGAGVGAVGVARLRLDRALATTPEFRDLGYFEKLVDEVDRATAPGAATGARPGADSAAAVAPDWSQIPAERRRDELVVRLRTILARELRVPAAKIDVDQPFPELGLDSMVAMTVLKETQQLVGVDLSASMLWNHPTVSALATHLVGLLAPPQADSPADLPEGDAHLTFDSSGGVLDELFDHVESAATGSAGSESGIF
ncbi:MAG TPA: SDR family NAD(P)-dependent oxidoreductase, partial [Mycobacterium sp.]|nr:SDR family NAD(P)-dependent oxidoreductase [Mycobacterium sp.]